MNPLPTTGTRWLGGIVIFLGTLLTNDTILGLLNAWKYGPATLVTLTGILTMLRGFQNSANNDAMAAAPPPSAMTTAAASKSMAKALWILLLISPVLIAMVLSGCQTTPATQSTVNQLLDVAGTSNNTAIKTADSLVLAHVITTTQLRAVVAVTDKIDTAIVLARSTYQAGGNAADAQTALTNISAELLAVTACLAQPTNVTTCIQAIP